MIYFNDRYFYANIKNPIYPIKTIGGIDYFNVGVVEVGNANLAISSGYTFNPIILMDKTDNIEIVTEMTGGIPKALVYIPVNIIEGMDGYALLKLTYTDNHSNYFELKSNVKTIPIENFVFPCIEQSDSINVWAIDLDTSCEYEALNGNALDVSITDILFTEIGERPRRLNYGSPINTILWNKLDNMTANTVLDKLLEILTRFERRILVERDKVSLMIDKQKHSIIITIPYIIKENQKKFLYRKKFVY